MSTADHSKQNTMKLEMAHVLFMDIVAYSTLPMDEQNRCLSELQQAVRATAEFVREQSSWSEMIEEMFGGQHRVDETRRAERAGWTQTK
jgi:hypothetical protein